MVKYVSYKEQGGWVVKSCLLCPKGTRCRGYMLHTLILKLYDVMEAGDNPESIARELSREDIQLLADYGEKARQTCWSKGFVMVVGRKLADLAAQGMPDAALRRAVERLIVRIDGLFAKLPNGIRVDLADLTMEVYNQACENLAGEGVKVFLPANILGQAYAAVLKGK